MPQERLTDQGSAVCPMAGMREGSHAPQAGKWEKEAPRDPRREMREESAR